MEVTAKVLAELYGVGLSAISNWHARDGCPRNANGTYDLRAVIAWREAKIEEKFEKIIEAGSSPAMERWREARADREELRLKQDLGELVPRAEVEAGRVARVLAIKRAFLSLPQRSAPVMEGMDARQIRSFLGEEIRFIIAQFAGQKYEKGLKETKTKKIKAKKMK
jgi:phage terminase Nu1 subunit (DNA packaging protein)